MKAMMKKSQIKQEEDDWRNDAANTKFTKRTTEQLVERKKEKKLSEIFLMLDSDGDGLISAQKIDISVLTPEILEIFTPLFCEMEEMG